MQNYYSKKYFIGYSDVDKKNRCKLSVIVNLLQNTATLHSKAIGMGTSELIEQNYSWILLFWRIKVLKNISSEMDIEVKTWYRKSNGLHVYRDFEVYDDEGNILLIATSTWIFYDRNKNKPVKPLEIYNDAMKRDERSVFGDTACEKIEDIQKADVMKDYIIQRRDIDTNNHMNNEKHIEYAIEVIPHEIYEEKYIEEIQVSYKRQIVYNERIYVELKEYGNDSFIEILRNESGEPCSMIKTWWK